MTKRLNYCAILLTIAVLLTGNLGQAQTRGGGKEEVDRTAAVPGRVKFSDLLARARPARRSGFALMPSRHSNASSPAFSFSLVAGPNLPVVGSGTVGRLTKWTGITSSNSFIGDSTIFESKFGLVGIGTDTPASKLTVAGTIQSLSGGFQFPDGTVQTTAGVAPDQVVRSLNGLMGDLTLVPGANVTITKGASSLTIAASGLLSGVSHDSTLKGNGTIGDPLGVAIPLILNGSVDPGPANTLGVIQLTNMAAHGIGIAVLADTAVRARGVDGNAAGGTAVSAEGGRGTVIGGFGVFSSGGSSESGLGGVGVIGRGGLSDSDTGGRGVDANGGSSNTGNGGTGVGGEGGQSSDGNGGRGVVAIGGRSFGAGKSGGIGIEATGGEAFNGATPGLAGKFNGDVDVTGTLSKGGGSFKIDHPLDPENRYLYHSFVESPDMKNIYDGNLVTDDNGEATVTLPEYFEALNRDFRYQLTVIGTFAQAIVAEEISGNRFVIRTSAPNVRVSWQVTGIRHDQWAEKNRIPVEVQKSERERGYYLHPEAFNQPEGRGVEWARNPELMKEQKQRRISGKNQAINKRIE